MMRPKLLAFLLFIAAFSFATSRHTSSKNIKDVRSSRSIILSRNESTSAPVAVPGAERQQRAVAIHRNLCEHFGYTHVAGTGRECFKLSTNEVSGYAYGASQDCGEWESDMEGGRKYEFADDLPFDEKRARIINFMKHIKCEKAMVSVSYKLWYQYPQIRSPSTFAESFYCLWYQCSCHQIIAKNGLIKRQRCSEKSKAICHL